MNCVYVTFMTSLSQGVSIFKIAFRATILRYIDTPKYHDSRWGTIFCCALKMNKFKNGPTQQLEATSKEQATQNA